MSVIAVELIWSGNNGSFSSTDQGRVSLQLIEIYNVFVDSPTTDTPLTVAADPLVKQLNTAHSGNQFLRVSKVDPVRVSPIQFTTTVTYTTASGGGNPLNEPAIVSWRTIKEMGEIDEDINGKPLVTANGEKIKGITRPFSNLAAVIKKNVATFNQQNFSAYIDHVDTSGILGSQVGTAILDDVSADQVVGAFTYFQMTSVIIFREPIRTTAAKAWFARVLHEGYNVKNDDGNIVRATDENGEFESSPVRLKSDGKRETAADAAHYLEFELLPTANLTTAGIL